MPKYQCEKGHIFTHAAKLTIGSIPHSSLELLTGLIDTAKTEDTSPEVAQLIGMFESIVKVMGEGTFEKYVCPDCRSHTFTEVNDATPKLSDVSSMIDVAPDAVDAKIAEGYIVLESWQKNVRLVKYKTEAKTA